MRILLIIITLLLIPSKVYALSPPTQISPSDGSSVSSPRVTWSVIENATKYRVIIDDESSVTSPYKKDYYTGNTHYTPQLAEGAYYWKVKSTEPASDWSTIWSFILSASPTPTPEPEAMDETSTSTPTPTEAQITLTLTPTPTPIPTLKPTPTPTKIPSLFNVESVPESIKSTETFRPTVSLTGLESEAQYYLKGAFIKEGSTNYFGETKVGNSWISNNSTYHQQLPIKTSTSGSWNGTFEVKPDPEDSGFTGSGEYLFKVGRYKDSGSGLTWSNQTKIRITALSESGLEKDIGQEIAKNDTTTSQNPDQAEKPETELKTLKHAIPQYLLGSDSAVAGASIAAKTPILKSSQSNLQVAGGGAIFLLGTGLLVYALKIR